VTAHIEAKKGEIAKTVLMPGDPLRAEFIAKNYLKDIKKVNSVRNMLMFTGFYKGKEVSVCGSGMGIPSIGIYSHELYNFYDVDNIIRVGSSGAYSTDLKIYDVVLVSEAYSDSKEFAKFVAGIDSHITYPSEELNKKLRDSAKELNITIHEERTHSTDMFYSQRTLEEIIQTTGAKCVEMEATALFSNAKVAGKKAACLLSISNHLITDESTSSSERETAFDDMIRVALNTL
jgi:purine-nucleoside phosphorylase